MRMLDIPWDEVRESGEIPRLGSPEDYINTGVFIIKPGTISSISLVSPSLVCVVHIHLFIFHASRQGGIPVSVKSEEDEGGRRATKGRRTTLAE